MRGARFDTRTRLAQLLHRVDVGEALAAEEDGLVRQRVLLQERDHPARPVDRPVHHAVGVRTVRAVRRVAVCARHRHARVDEADRVTELLWEAQMPRQISHYGVTEEDLPRLAAMAAKQWTAQFNPRPVTEADFVELFRAAL